MPAVMVVTHGPLSQALLDTAQMVLGDIGGARALSFYPGDGPEDLTTALTDSAAKAGSMGGLLCLTDLQGGTPARVAATLTTSGQVEVICGVNLPMVLEVLSAGDRPLQELTAQAVVAGRDSVIDLGEALRRRFSQTTSQEGADQ